MSATWACLSNTGQPSIAMSTEPGFARGAARLPASAGVNAVAPPLAGQDEPGWRAWNTRREPAGRLAVTTGRSLRVRSSAAEPPGYAGGAPSRSSPPAARGLESPAGCRERVRAHCCRMMNPRWAHDPYRIYVPNSISNTVTEINPPYLQDHQDVRRRCDPNHVTPSWDGSVLWVNDTRDFQPHSDRSQDRQAGQACRGRRSYNLYFTPDGKERHGDGRGAKTGSTSSTRTR